MSFEDNPPQHFSYSQKHLTIPEVKLDTEAWADSTANVPLEYTDYDIEAFNSSQANLAPSTATSNSQDDSFKIENAINGKCCDCIGSAHWSTVQENPADSGGSPPPVLHVCDVYNDDSVDKDDMSMVDVENFNSEQLIRTISAGIANLNTAEQRSFSNGIDEASSVASSSILICDKPEFGKHTSEHSYSIPAHLIQNYAHDAAFSSSLLFKGVDYVDLHPRIFQNHVLLTEWRTKLPENHPFKYQRNINFPLSAAGQRHLEHRCGHAKLNAVSYRYIRVRKDGKGRKEVMCRFCTNKRWFSLKSYKHHLLFSHGILTAKIFHTPKTKSENENEFITFLPLPSKFYEQNNRGLLDCHVQCPCCGNWVLLGRAANEDNELLDHFGLYAKYFFHVAKCITNIDEI